MVFFIFEGGKSGTEICASVIRRICFIKLPDAHKKTERNANLCQADRKGELFLRGTCLEHEVCLRRNGNKFLFRDSFAKLFKFFKFICQVVHGIAYVIRFCNVYFQL